MRRPRARRRFPWAELLAALALGAAPAWPAEATRDRGWGGPEEAAFRRAAAPPDNPTGLCEEPERVALLDPERLVRALGIRPMDTVLDLGAGVGFLTFRLAPLLSGGGRLFATEIEPSRIQILEQRAKTRGFANVFPVLVRPEGLDPFYARETFDVVVVSEVLPFIWDYEAFFRGLLPSLREHAGRLFLIEYRTIPGWNVAEFGDFKGAVAALRAAGRDAPVPRRLRPELRAFLFDALGQVQEDLPAPLRPLLVEDFERMLDDAALPKELIVERIERHPEDTNWAWPAALIDPLDRSEIELVKWLYVTLDADGVLGPRPRPDVLPEASRRSLRKLNKLVLKRTYKADKLIVTEDHGQPYVYRDEKAIVSTLEAAGYRFVREVGLLTQYFVLEFQRK